MPFASEDVLQRSPDETKAQASAQSRMTNQDEKRQIRRSRHLDQTRYHRPAGQDKGREIMTRCVIQEAVIGARMALPD